MSMYFNVAEEVEALISVSKSIYLRTIDLSSYFASGLGEDSVYEVSIRRQILFDAIQSRILFTHKYEPCRREYIR